MSSRSFISILISLTALAVGWIYLILGPDFSTERKAVIETGSESAPAPAPDRELRLKKRIKASIQSKSSKAAVRPQQSDTPLAGTLDPHLERLFNQISPSVRDDRIVQKLGRTPESKFIRFAIAFALNDFQSSLSDSERVEIRKKIDQSMRNGRVELFQGLEMLAVEGATEGAATMGDKDQSRVVRSLLSQAAVDNPYAQMMVQDLIVREFYRDSTQNFSQVAERYEIRTDHPLYGRINKAFNRQPASQ